MNNENMILTRENIENSLKFSYIVYSILKRTFDVFFSFVGMIYLLPLTIIIKILYLISGDFGSVFYFHERIGKNGKKFKMLKYRTMVKNSNEILEEMLKNKKYLKEWNEFHKFEDDPRVTKIGKILRKTSIDEIPQLINIFKGDMSFIGPRPMIDEEVNDYGSDKDKLLSIRPGLTGWWACNGRSNISKNERKELELYYIENCSIWLDIKIIFKTIGVVFIGRGAK